jgi:hypothetical protein
MWRAERSSSADAVVVLRFQVDAKDPVKIRVLVEGQVGVHVEVFINRRVVVIIMHHEPHGC